MNLSDTDRSLPAIARITSGDLVNATPLLTAGALMVFFSIRHGQKPKVATHEVYFLPAPVRERILNMLLTAGRAAKDID